MDRKNFAKEKFQAGYSCSQAILAAYASEYNLDTTLALKLATPFSGGIAGTQGLCGIVSGALMVIGLKHGQFDMSDPDSKSNCNEIAKNFMAEFEKANNSLQCKELFSSRGHTKTPEIARKICPDFIDVAIDILEVI